MTNEMKERLKKVNSKKKAEKLRKVEEKNPKIEKQQRLLKKKEMLLWVTKYLEENIERWEKERVKRIEDEKRTIRDWEKLTRGAKIKKLKKIRMNPAGSDTEQDEDKTTFEEDEKWLKWRENQGKIFRVDGKRAESDDKDILDEGDDGEKENSDHQKGRELEKELSILQESEKKVEEPEDESTLKAGKYYDKDVISSLQEENSEYSSPGHVTRLEGKVCETNPTQKGCLTKNDQKSLTGNPSSGNAATPGNMQREGKGTGYSSKNSASILKYFKQEGEFLVGKTDPKICPKTPPKMAKPKFQSPPKS